MKYALILLILLNLYLLHENRMQYKEISKEKEKQKETEEAKETIKKYYEVAQENNERAIKLKHDIHNEIQIAYAVVEESREKAKKMLEKIEEDTQKIKTVKYTENKILNTLLTIKFEEAKRKNIKIEANIKISNTPIENLDLCKMLSNIIDNSIEGTEKTQDKHIKIAMVQKSNYIIIKCENTYNKNAIKLKQHLTNKSHKSMAETEVLETTKKDKLNHGYGNKIVKEIVKKYNGEINYNHTEEWFNVTIAIPITNV